MNDLVKVDNNNFLINEEYVEKYKQFLQLKDYIELADKTIKQNAIDFMEATGKKNIESNGLIFTYREGTTRTSLDSKKLKEELPDIYEEYSKTSEVASSVIVKVLE